MNPLPTFPLPVPSSSRRVIQRRKRALASVGHTNKVISSLNSLSHSFISSHSQSSTAIAQPHLPSYAHRLSRNVHERVTAYRRQCSGDADVDATLDNNIPRPKDDSEVFIDIDKLFCT